MCLCVNSKTFIIDTEGPLINNTMDQGQELFPRGLKRKSNKKHSIRTKNRIHRPTCGVCQAEVNISSEVCTYLMSRDAQTDGQITQKVPHTISEKQAVSRGKHNKGFKLRQSKLCFIPIVTNLPNISPTQPTTTTPRRLTKQGV